MNVNLQELKDELIKRTSADKLELLKVRSELSVKRGNIVKDARKGFEKFSSSSVHSTVRGELIAVSIELAEIEAMLDYNSLRIDYLYATIVKETLSNTHNVRTGHKLVSKYLDNTATGDYRIFPPTQYTFLIMPISEPKIVKVKEDNQGDLWFLREGEKSNKSDMGNAELRNYHSGETEYQAWVDAYELLRTPGKMH